METTKEYEKWRKTFNEWVTVFAYVTGILIGFILIGLITTFVF